MRVDVSEIKEYRTCKRKWKLSSRNAFHLVPKVTPPQFALGTLFHESLHQLYLGVPLDDVMDFVKHEMKSDNDTALLAMVPGYAKNVLPHDIDRYTVLEIEHKFSFTIAQALSFFGVSATDPVFAGVDLSTEICGSIDMVAVENETNRLFGFEHKTAKAFRDSTFLWMDEQPRIYTIALLMFVDQLNQQMYDDWNKNEYIPSGGKCGAPPESYTFGGVYINEVKKLLRQFDCQRSLCEYPGDDLRNFMIAFFGTVAQCQQSVATDDFAAPMPSYFACQMCTFKTICETYMYSTLDKKIVLEEFAEEFSERTEDHLDEKVERPG